MRHSQIHSAEQLRELLTRLNLYCDGELTPVQCAELEAHVRYCSDCGALYDTLATTASLYQALGEASTELPRDLEDRLLGRVLTVCRC